MQEEDATFQTLTRKTIANRTNNQAQLGSTLQMSRPGGWWAQPDRLCETHNDDQSESTGLADGE